MIEGVDCSDSSDEEVYFGKYTLKEAKRDISKYIPKKLNRRHTLNLKLSNSKMSIDNKETKNIVDDLNNYLDQHLNISSIPSEYLSANESGSSKKQSMEGDFIQKLTNVINDNSSKESSYKTACDQTNTTVSTNDDCNETKAEFIKRFEYQPMLENIQHTLVENTITEENVPGESTISHEDDDSVIILSDDSFQMADLVPKEEVNSTNSSFRHLNDNITIESVTNEVEHINSLYQKTNSSSEIDSTVSTNELNISDVDKDDNILSEPFINKKPILINNATTNNINEKYNRLYNWNYLSKISEKTETTTFIENNDIQQKDSYNSIPEYPNSDSKSQKLAYNLPASSNSNDLKLNEKLDISEDSQDLDGFEVPKINLEQFDDSCNFDDTLEEMNRFLTEDFNPEPRKYLSNASQGNKGSDSSLNSLSSSSKASSVEKHKIFYSAEKISKPKTNLYSCKTIEKTKNLHTQKTKSPMSKKTLFTNGGAKSKADVFKVPNKPPKTVLTPNKPTNIFLKNVVSPVSVYINNTPKYSPIVKNSITQKRLEKTNSTLAKKENVPVKSSNLDEIPAVIYKPAKTKHITHEKDLNLPGSIKKLIKDPILTKHCQKIVDCDESIERKLMEEEVSIDNSLIGKTDISVLTNRQALIFKK